MRSLLACNADFQSAPEAIGSARSNGWRAVRSIEDYPRYGHALFVEGVVVGVLLPDFFAPRHLERQPRCLQPFELCVDQEHRGHSAMLHLSSVKRKEVTYVNISPALYTRKAIEAFGFRRFSEGQMVVAPILSAARRKTRVIAFDECRPEAALLSENERQILTDHAAMGCRALLCLEDGAAFPFVFQPRRVVRDLIPCPHLIYCREAGDFVRFASPIGRYLMLRSETVLRHRRDAACAGACRPVFLRTHPRNISKDPEPPVSATSPIPNWSSSVRRGQPRDAVPAPPSALVPGRRRRSAEQLRRAGRVSQGIAGNGGGFDPFSCHE